MEEYDYESYGNELLHKCNIILQDEEEESDDDDASMPGLMARESNNNFDYENTDDELSMPGLIRKKDDDEDLLDYDKVVVTSCSLNIEIGNSNL